MDEAETLSDHVVILDRGRTIEEGRPAGMIKRHFDTFILQVNDSPPMQALLKEENIPFFSGYGQLTVYSSGGVIDDLTTRITGEELVRRRPNLEDLFIKLTGRSL
jgi:ABC-type multidrug transport system ATPase subunit